MVGGHVVGGDRVLHRRDPSVPREARAVGLQRSDVTTTMSLSSNLIHALLQPMMAQLPLSENTTRLQFNTNTRTFRTNTTRTRLGT